MLVSSAMTGELGYMAAHCADSVHSKPIEIDVVIAGFRKISASKTPRYRTPTLDEFNHQHIRNVLAQCKGNKAQAARLLGISRERLGRLLHRTGR